MQKERTNRTQSLQSDREHLPTWHSYLNIASIEHARSKLKHQRAFPDLVGKSKLLGFTYKLIIGALTSLCKPSADRMLKIIRPAQGEKLR